jgi:GDP-L-fucose synthase
MTRIHPVHRENRMKILMFGGGGFLGTRLVPMLERAGHHVIAPRSSACDLTRPPGDLSAFGKPDIIVHAAAIYGGMPFDMENQAEIFTRNMKMNIHVFEIAAAVGAKRIVTVGSACAYPGEADRDFTEADLFTGALHPTVECHGFTKLAMVVGNRSYFASHGLSGIHLLPANLYGPGDVYQERRAHVVAALIKKFTDAVAIRSDVHLLGDGAPIREFMYIDDLALAILRACEVEIDGVALVNVGTGTGVSIRELAAVLAELTGFAGAIHWAGSASNGAMRKVMRVDRMQSVLGLDAPTGLREGLARTLEWYWPNKVAADARA